MIKILFLLETLDGGGAEKVLCNLVNNMDKERFDITVQTVWNSASASQLSEAVHYRYVFETNNRFNAILYRFETALGLIYRLHMRDQYDIECAYLESGATKIIAGSTNKKAKKVAWVHCDLQKAMPEPAMFARKTEKYYKKYDRVVCVSKQGKKSFQELFGNTVKTDIVYNTVDREEILLKADEPMSDLPTSKLPLVVSLGRLSEPKCYMRLLKSHKRLIDIGIKHNLLILGEGPERNELEGYITTNHLENSVRLPGYKRNPYPYLKAADLLVCSSVYECYSTFIAEGLILGKPIVTTNVSGMKEMLGESLYGYITDNDDESFYQGMKRMLLDADLRNQYSRKAVIQGKSFSTEKSARDTEKYFIKLLQERR